MRRDTPNTLAALLPYAVLMDTRRFRAPSHSCLKESTRLISEYHHWISGVGFPTTSQYSSKVSPVSLVSDRGDFTKPADGCSLRTTGEGRKNKGDEIKKKPKKERCENLNQRADSENVQSWSLMFKNIKLIAVNSGRLSDCVTSIHLQRARRPRLRFSHYCCYSWEALIRLHWDVLAALLSGLLMTSYKYAHVSYSWAPMSFK